MGNASQPAPLKFEEVLELVDRGATVVIKRDNAPDVVITSGQRNPDLVTLIPVTMAGQRNPDFQPDNDDSRDAIGRLRGGTP